MVFKWLFGSGSGSWSKDLPQLYPGLDGLQLSQFLSEQDYRRIKSFANVYVLPFADDDGEDEQVCFGFGLSRLMIRNLMLLRDVSIHGPEDTPQVGYTSAPLLANRGSRSHYVTGVAEIGSEGYSLQIDILRPDQAVTSGVVRHGNFRTFVQECSAIIARSLGSRMDLSVDDGWEVGQPCDADSLLRYGELLLGFDRKDPRGRSRAAKELLAEDPNFTAPAWEVDDELPGAQQVYLKAYERDPYNAQLCFGIFCSVWSSQGHQPEALQFCRRAIELSPGHGKAHMCVPHAAHPRADMIRHSELGYRLLPGNSFAVNNYILYLTQNGAPAEKLIELAEEGIDTDPRDPGNYERLIELCCERGDYRTALTTAERLQELFEPEMDERALYCLKQNPERARMIDSGEYDPAAENRSRIAQLCRQLRRGRDV